MTVIAPRSSATARVSRNARSGVGSADPITARTASANAMSVAIGTTVAASTSAPPTVSSRNASATNRRSGSGSRARRCRGDMRLPGSARSSADQTSRRAAVSVAAEANRLAEEVADAELEDEVAQPQVGPGQGDGDRRHDPPGPGELPETDRDAVAGGEARDDDVRAGPDRRRVAAEVRAER